MTEKVLVAGGGGFIGSNFVRQALERTDWRFTIFDDFSHAKIETLSDLPQSRVAVIRGNICEIDSLREALRGMTLAVNFAAESHNDTSLVNPKAFVDTNIIGTFNFLELARSGNFRYHHISTDEVYGDLELDQTSKFDISSPYNPSSPYSATKASSDLLVRAWVRSFGIAATISNCTNNFGPWQHVEKFIPRQITNILCGVKPRIYGTGAQIRDWIHVDDHNLALLRILEAGEKGQTYLISANQEFSNLEVVKKINEIMGRDNSNYEHVQDRPGHDKRYALDNTKLRIDLGWQPTFTNFDECLEQTVTWYQGNKSWWEQTKFETEEKYKEIGR